MPEDGVQPSIFTPRDHISSQSSQNTAQSTATQHRTAENKSFDASEAFQEQGERIHETDTLRSVWNGIDDKQFELDTAKSGRKRSASHLDEQHPQRLPSPIFQRPTTPDLARRKRQLEIYDSNSATDPKTKKPRLKPRLKYELDGFSFGFSNHFVEDHPPPSPLFFSHSPRPRPELPPRFSSSEAGARMLSKARNEDQHVKTVSLTRGTISGIPTSTPLTASAIRRSLERSSTGRSHSPESNNGREYIGNNASAHLNSIGVIELLEQDERPTLIVDLSDSSNYGPGPLHPLFTNLSLRAMDGLLEYVQGTVTDQSPDTVNFIQFKSWLLSATVNGESLNVCLPPFTYAGISWSCSTLRKRLRIISGVFSQAQQSKLPTSQSGSVIPSAPPSAPPAVQEASDYFESTTATTASANAEGVSAGSVPTEIVPSIEKSGPIRPGGTVQALHGNISSSSGHSDHPGTPQTLALSSTQISPNIPGYDEVQSAFNLPVEDLPSFDWTRIPISDTMPEHVQFARSVNWAATSLGPIEDWSPDLRQMCNLIMASPHPAAMYWGEDLIAIYNEAYVMLAGQKHPTLMGQSYKEAWKEIWDDVKDVFASAKSTGEATMKDDDCLFIKRNSYLEEAYFSWSIIPMLGDDGSVMGLYNPAFEKTRRKIAERRMLTLREVGERTAAARDVKAFWSQVLGAFDLNEYDSPFLLLYSVNDENDSDSSSMHSHSTSINTPRYCFLEGALGIPSDHPAATHQIELKNGMEGFGPVFRDVMRADKPMLFDVGSRDLPASLLEGLDLRGFADPVRSVVVCPIHPTTGENVLGFLVLGVNPRRPYDDDYSLFVQLLSRQLATSLASVVLFEEEIRRGQKAATLAALDRIELSEQLAARTQEAIESETKFTRMAEFAPVGIFIADSDGRITFANDVWYEVSGVPKGTNLDAQWVEAVKPEDRDHVARLWDDLVVSRKEVSSEFRFKGQQGKSDTWVLFSGYPETYDNGRLKSVFGSITNISEQKWAEGMQTRKMEEAIELKRQQENFIDITSHEMRNPLSAILQCADEIQSSLNRIRANPKAPTDDLLTSCLEAAQTISLCSQHQKRIVDDVLTLSKLDSKLLLVTPVDAQPLVVVQRALKMHEGELQAADIQMKFVVEQSFKDLTLDWLRFDPSRVLQVLINLTTNAIKFTTTESKRIITVSIAASRKRPSELADAPVKYIPARNKNHDPFAENDWGKGEEIFVHFSIRDTGRGLTHEEKKLLFMRFSQASPRTHVQYGGSGLGLFISRELTELQGGEIGVASEAGKGSTFAFYIAARRSTPPNEGDPASSMMTRFANGAKAKKSEASASAPTAATAEKTNVPRRVLIVEDNLVNQRVLQRQLKNLGTEVHLANHGGEALEKLKQSTYWADSVDGKKLELGVVLMDQEMPVMDGLTCTKKIRELEKEGKLTGHVPIIAVTANARQEQIQTAMDAGMDDVVSKPFRIPDLMPKIEELQLRFPMPSA